MRKLSTKALSVRLSIIVISSLVIISVYSVYTNYTRHISSAKENTLEKLHSITKTLGESIDWKKHQYLTNTFTKKDQIKKNDDDKVYSDLHGLLKRAQLANGIKTDIYTLFFEENKLYFCLTSGENPYFRHEYKSYPEEIKKFYNEGSFIGPYTDQHGTWLSGFAPVKDNNGKTVCIIQADIEFDHFLAEARKGLINDIITSLIVFTIITSVVVFIVRKLAKIDEERNKQLADAFADLKVKNKNITDSINYARRIQRALIPNDEKIEKHLKKYFMFYEPRDVVSGDFPWFYQKDHYIYLAAIDCTGHGVPGAMMSIIGCLLLNDVANNDGYPTAGELLNNLHKSVVNTLQQEEPNSIADGMDAAVCRIDTRDNEVCYAGAHRPLYHLKNGEIIQFKGDKYPVGGVQYSGANHFEDKVVQPHKGESIFFFSDGLPDQFGGDEGKKFGPKRIRDIILNEENFEKLNDKFRKAYFDWKGKQKQTDDILLIGIKF